MNWPKAAAIHVEGWKLIRALKNKKPKLRKLKRVEKAEMMHHTPDRYFDVKDLSWPN